MYSSRVSIKPLWPLLLLAGPWVVTPVSAQEVTEIPFFNAPEGTAALGGGLRFGQSPYFATDNEDQRQLDLLPLYLYEGERFFFRGSAGGLHFVHNENWELNAFARYRFQKLDPDSNELRITTGKVQDSKVQETIEGLGYTYKGLAE